MSDEISTITESEFNALFAKPSSSINTEIDIPTITESAYNQQFQSQSPWYTDLARGALISGPLKLGGGVADVLAYPGNKALDYLLGTNYAEGPGISSAVQNELLPSISPELVKESTAREIGEFVSPVGTSNLLAQGAAGLGAYGGKEIAEAIAPESGIAQAAGILAGASAPMAVSKTVQRLANFLAPVSSTAKKGIEAIREIVPDALKQSLTSDERARIIAKELRDEMISQKGAASKLFEALPEEKISLSPAIDRIRSVYEKAEGPIQPSSNINKILNYLEGKGKPEQVVETPASLILDPATGRPAIAATTEIIPAVEPTVTLPEFQNVLRDVGDMAYNSTQGVSRHVAREAKKALTETAEQSLSEPGKRALDEARSAWAEVKNAFDKGATAKTIASLEKGGKLKTLKQQLLNDAKSTEELVNVMNPEQVEHAKHIMLQEMFSKEPITWEKFIGKKYDSFKTVFGAEDTARLQEMLAREGTVGKEFLTSNYGLGMVLGDTALKSLSFFSGNPILQGIAAGLTIKDARSAIGRSRGKALLMRAAAGNPKAVKILNSPFKTKGEFKTSLKKVVQILAEEPPALDFVEQAMDRAETKMIAPSTEFLDKEEGGQQLTPYRPKVAGSGVTVGTGVDLGSRNLKDLIDLGVSEELRAKLMPFLGKKDEEAERALEESTVRLTQEEANELDSVVKQDIFSKVSMLYNTDSEIPFEQIPEQAKEVIYSLAYNFGPSLDKAIPGIWNELALGNWRQAAQRMMNAKWKQPELKARRIREAKKLMMVA